MSKKYKFFFLDQTLILLILFLLFTFSNASKSSTGKLIKLRDKSIKIHDEELKILNTLNNEITYKTQFFQKSNQKENASENNGNKNKKFSQFNFRSPRTCLDKDLEEIIKECEDLNILSSYCYSFVQKEFYFDILDNLSLIKIKINEIVSYSNSYKKTIQNISSNLHNSSTIYDSISLILDNSKQMDDNSEQKNKRDEFKNKIQNFIINAKIRNDKLKKEENKIFDIINLIEEESENTISKIDNLVEKISKNLNNYSFEDDISYDIIGKCYKANEIKEQCKEIENINISVSKILESQRYLNQYK